MQLGHQARTDVAAHAGSRAVLFGDGTGQRLQPEPAVPSIATLGSLAEGRLRAEGERKGKFPPAGIRETAQFTRTLLRLSKAANV